MNLPAIPAKTIVARTKSTAWFGTEYNMNIYKGCCHGCIYCDSRSACYGVEAFDTVRVKENALEIIRNDLRAKTRTGVVGTGAMSDPYNPFEKETCLTRHALELLAAYGFGAAIATKSPLIVRDIDVLCEVRAGAPVLCKITVTSCDDAFCKKVEPHVAPASARFAAIEQLAAAGLFTGVLLMPVLPFLEDTHENILGIVRCARESGARFIYPAFGMTLRANQRAWYFDQLDALFPGENLRARYMARYRNAYQCSSPRAKELWQIFKQSCDEAGLLYQMRDIIAGYKQGYQSEQLSFF